MLALTSGPTVSYPTGHSLDEIRGWSSIKSPSQAPQPTKSNRLWSSSSSPSAPLAPPPLLLARAVRETLTPIDSSRSVSGEDVPLPEERRPRVGGHLGGARRAVPGDAGAAGDAVGARPQDLHHPIPPAAAHRRRRSRRRQGPRHPALLHHHQRGARALHLPYHPALHRAVPALFLPREAPGQPDSARSFHRRHQLRCGHDMRLHQWQGHSIVCNSHNSGCGQPDCLHFLGCKEGSRLCIPRPLPVRLPHCAACVCIHPDPVPSGQDLPDDLWRAGVPHLQRVHRL